MITERTASELERELGNLSVEELEDAVKLHNYRYWVENNPTIPDPLFDRLVEQLRALAPHSPVLDAIGAAGAGELLGDDLGYGEKVEHEVPMLSLDKAYDAETVGRWFDRFTGDAVGSPKVDGIACSLRYQGGRLVLGATRGNGVRGEVITENVKRVANIPQQIPAQGALEVRGEVYMPISVFERFAGEYANPRNLAAGALKQKDAEATGRYDLCFFAYDLRGEPCATEVEKFARLRELGFTPVPHELVTRERIQGFYEEIVALRATADYEMDGVVYRANVCAEQERLGHTSHHPRFAIAYKFQGESGVSRLVGVEWSVSRTSAINPVAVVEPVVLSGATVTRASLHNLAFVENLGLKLGSTVLMTRRGGVIPHVERVVEPGMGEIEVPTHCPECGHTPTERRGDFLYCTSPACGRVTLSLLKHYVDAIECKGFGPKIIERLHELGILHTPADYYGLTVDQLLPIERMGETLAQKLVDAIDEKRTLPLDAFLRALAIPDLGRSVSRWVASHFGEIGAIREATVEQLAAIPGLGETTGRNILEGLEARSAVIDALLEHVSLVAPVAPEASEAVGDGPLAGKRVLFTGTLESMKRKDAQDKVRAAGGQTPEAVSRELDYLVIGDADLARFRTGWRSSKLKKAEKLNEEGASIQIIGESQFLALVGEAEVAEA